VNWSWFLLRSAIALTLLTLLFLSQRFWYRSIWRATANWRIIWLRVAVRIVYVTVLVLIIGSAVDGFRMGYRHHLIPDAKITMLAGLWFTSALFAYFAVKLVRVIERLWASLRSVARRNSASRPANFGGQVSGSKRRVPGFKRDTRDCEASPDCRT